VESRGHATRSASTPRATETTPPEPPVMTPPTLVSSVVAPPESPQETRFSRETSDPAPIIAETHERPLHGPSFLGLSEETSDDDPLHYLLEDEPKSPSRWRWYIAALVLIAFAAVIGYEWKITGGGNPIKPKPAAQKASAPAEQAPQHPPSNTTSSSIGGAQETTTPPPPPAAQAEKAQATTEPPPATRPEPASTTSDGARNATAAPDEGGDVEEAQLEEAEPPSKATAGQAASKPSPARPAQPTVDNTLLTRAESYLYGRGVPRSCDQAMVYLRAAAQQPNAKARSQMGALYATGRCVPQDRVVAYQWFSRALNTDPHNVWLERNREMLWRQMSEDERQRAMRGAEYSSVAR